MGAVYTCWTVCCLCCHMHKLQLDKTSRSKEHIHSNPLLFDMTQDLLAVLYLATHVDWYAHNDDWDGDARYKGDDHRRSEQHAHLPQNLAGLRPWFLPPERTS